MISVVISRDFIRQLVLLTNQTGAQNRLFQWGPGQDGAERIIPEPETRSSGSGEAAST